MMDCAFCNGTRTIYAGYTMTWEGPVSHYEVCEACCGLTDAEVSSQDWQAFEAMRLEAEREDFAEACAGLDGWYRAQQGAAA